MADILQFLNFDPIELGPLLLQITLIFITGMVLNTLIIRSVSRLQERENLDRRVIRQIGLIARYVVFLVVFLVSLSVAGAARTGPRRP